MAEDPTPDTVPTNVQHYEEGFDLGGLIAWLLQHQADIGNAVKKIKDEFKGKPKPPVTPVTPPTPVTPAPVAPVNDYSHVPSGLSLRFKGLKRNGAHISDAELKAIKDGSDPVNVDGDVLNFDINPLDAHGEVIEKDTAPLAGLLVDPALGTYLNVGDEVTSTDKKWPDGFNNHRIAYTIEGPADLGGEYRNYGCGPNLNPTAPGDIYITAHMTRADGIGVISNRIGPIRAKQW
jgi:hypothetical protein